MIDKLEFLGLKTKIPGSNRHVNKAVLLLEGATPLGIIITSIWSTYLGHTSTTGYPLFPIAYPEAVPLHSVGRYRGLPHKFLPGFISELLDRQPTHSSIDLEVVLLDRLEWCTANYNPLFVATHLPHKAKFLYHPEMLQMHPANGVVQYREYHSKNRE